jgi:hypothetical protein
VVQRRSAAGIVYASRSNATSIAAAWSEAQVWQQLCVVLKEEGASAFACYACCTQRPFHCLQLAHVIIKHTQHSLNRVPLSNCLAASLVHATGPDSSSSSAAGLHTASHHSALSGSLRYTELPAVPRRCRSGSRGPVSSLSFRNGESPGV